MYYGRQRRLDTVAYSILIFEIWNSYGVTMEITVFGMSRRVVL
jgi:hypothetical protein